MESLSIPSVSEQTIIENNVNNKLLLPRKPARQPNPVIHRKLRRGSAAARIHGKKFERSTDKELLKTIALLTNATKPEKAFPYKKGYLNEYDEDEEWTTESEDEERHSVFHDEKGKQEPHHEIRSIQKSSKNSTHMPAKHRKRKSSHIDRANKECNVSSHVIHVKDITETLDCNPQGLTGKLCGSGSTCESTTFIQFCSTEIICPHEYRATLAVKLYGVQAALLSALGNPFENISQSMSSINNGTHNILVLSMGQASIGFLPAMIWTGMFVVCFVYTTMVVWSLAFRVPIISMLCLALLYCLSLLVATVSGFNVLLCGTFRMSGILFAFLGVLAFVLLLLVSVMLVLFASWRRTN